MISFFALRFLPDWTLTALVRVLLWALTFLFCYLFLQAPEATAETETVQAESRPLKKDRSGRLDVCSPVGDHEELSDELAPRDLNLDIGTHLRDDVTPLLKAAGTVRTKFRELGLSVDGVRIRDSRYLSAGGYRITIRDQPMVQNQAGPDSVLLYATPGTLSQLGLPKTPHGQWVARQPLEGHPAYHRCLVIEPALAVRSDLEQSIWLGLDLLVTRDLTRRLPHRSALPSGQLKALVLEMLSQGRSLDQLSGLARGAKTWDDPGRLVRSLPWQEGLAAEIEQVDRLLLAAYLFRHGPTVTDFFTYHTSRLVLGDRDRSELAFALLRLDRVEKNELALVQRVARRVAPQDDSSLAQMILCLLRDRPIERTVEPTLVLAGLLKAMPQPLQARYLPPLMASLTQSGQSTLVQNLAAGASHQELSETELYRLFFGTMEDLSPVPSGGFCASLARRQWEAHPELVKAVVRYRWLAQPGWSDRFDQFVENRPDHTLRVLEALAFKVEPRRAYSGAEKTALLARGLGLPPARLTDRPLPLMPSDQSVEPTCAELAGLFQGTFGESAAV